MIRYIPEVYGCIQRSSYSTKQSVTSSVQGSLKGRPRNILHDIYPVETCTFQIAMKEEAFMGFQHFWASIGYGADWFNMEVLGVDREVHSTGPFSAVYSEYRIWDVSWPVEMLI